MPCPIGFPQRGVGSGRLATKAGVNGAIWFGQDAVDQRSSLTVARRWCVVDDVADEHTGPVDRSRLIRLAAASGCALRVSGLDERERSLLGRRLRGVLAQAPPAVRFERPIEREAYSIALRRASICDALETVSSDRSSVTVIVPSRRPERWATAFEMLARQEGVTMQVVLVSHGRGRPSAAVTAPLSDCDVDLVTLERDASWTLGDLLNAGLDAADGDVVVKWDDDDVYGPHHLLDLILARSYSGADLVGKGAEFVRLTSGDVVRRFVGGGESFVPLVSGATLTIGRSELVELGGFSSVSSGEDVDLARRVVDAGGSVYRTHGFGFVVVRGEDATWRRGDLGIRLQSEGTVPPADLQLCDVDVGLLGAAASS